MDDRIKKVIETVNAELGRNKQKVLQVLGFEDEVSVKRFSTGLADVDSILGGGIPAGSFMEIFGWESVGKTTFAIHSLGNKKWFGGTFASAVEP